MHRGKKKQPVLAGLLHAGAGQHGICVGGRETKIIFTLQMRVGADENIVGACGLQTENSVLFRPLL